jgi:hypothetical protein
MADNGTIQFEALGQVWALRFDINAFCRIEEELGIEDAEAFQQMLGQKLSFRKLRALFACALAPAATLEEAGEIITALGLERTTELIRAGIEAAFPNAKGAPSPKGPPPSPAAGTG